MIYTWIDNDGLTMTDCKTIASKQMQREKSLTSLVLSAKAMELLLTKERMRCDRHCQFFSLIVFEIDLDDLHALGEILNNRLRLTDETGLLLKGGVGVLLPMTEIHGAKVVLQSIRQLASRQRLAFDAEIFTYSGRERPFHNSEQNDALEADSDSDIAFEDESDADDTVVEPPSALSKATSRIAPQNPGNRTVRADRDSQTMRACPGKILSTSTVPTSQLCRQYPRWKRCMDIVCAAFGLVVALPVFFIAAIAIKLTSRGPVFFRQIRTGQFGNAFPIYKMRTMGVDAEELKGKLEDLNERDGPAFKIKKDPRVTTVGVFLRKTGLDELPQLWNVLIGDMAIVGPRPLPCNEDAQCKLWQRRRLDIKPGLTCIWQISKSRKIPFSDWMRMDLQYADSITIFGDIRLIFKTVKAVVLGRIGH